MVDGIWAFCLVLKLLAGVLICGTIWRGKFGGQTGVVGLDRWSGGAVTDFGLDAVAGFCHDWLSVVVAGELDACCHQAAGCAVGLAL